MEETHNDKIGKPSLHDAILMLADYDMYKIILDSYNIFLTHWVEIK